MTPTRPVPPLPLDRPDSDRRAVMAGAATLAAALLPAPAVAAPAPAPAPTPGATGTRRLFADQTYHFQALRVLTDAVAGGADISEVLETIAAIPEGDASAWHDRFAATAARNAALAETCRDPISAGYASLRAHTYWRTAEFLLPPDDPRRPAAWTRQIAAFDDGLARLGVAHQRFSVPYAGAALRCIYYPGPGDAARKPLLVFVGGYDSTLEELYFMLARGANERGYAVLTYEGPGQGAALREHGLTFTPAWEKPTAAVLDAFLATRPAPPAIVLVGMSMGGYLAPRAAAFDPRIDGVVAFDVFFDMGATARAFATLAANPKTAAIPGVRWAVDTARWTLGVADTAAFVAAFQDYTLAPVAKEIRGDVLILVGEADHFVPAPQADAFAAALTGARSVETVRFDRPSGGAEHCQLGAMTLWHATLFDWLARRFA